MPNPFSILDRKYLFKFSVNVDSSERLKQTKVTMGFDVQLNFMAIALFNSRLSVCYETRGLSIFFVFISGVNALLRADNNPSRSPSFVEILIICSRTLRVRIPNAISPGTLL